MDVKHISACVPAHGHPIIPFPASASGCQGTSLMDVLMTLTIASLLLGIGIPGFQSYLASSQLVSSTNLLSGSLALARSEAVKRNRHVVICKSRDQQNCTTAGSWRQGWIIFEDRLPNRERDENEPLIFAKSRLPDALRLDYAAFRSSNFIAFRATGITKTNGTFTLCYHQDAHSARALILSKSGRVRFSRTRADGRPLRCPEEE
ncbi:MAG TPA: hypothetical protein ENI68_06460 [Gammaproteobacteria bacterium]|nr:hypothetical protein [Gammaproteobacteria bacterium]